MANRLNRFQSSRARGMCGRSILVRHHYCDGRFRRVHVERATHGNQFYKSSGAVVVAHIKRERQAVLSLRRFADSKAEHPENIPQPSGFVLASHVRWHGYISIKRCACDENRKLNSGFLRGLGHFDLKAVGKPPARTVPAFLRSLRVPPMRSDSCAT